MNWIKTLSRPSAFGLSLGLLLLIIYASLRDWGVTGVIFIVLAYFLGYATATAAAEPDQGKSIQDHIQSLNPEIRGEITKLTKEGRNSEAVDMIKATTGLGASQATELVERIAHR